MAFLDKIMFWKKGEDEDLKGLGLGGEGPEMGLGKEHELGLGLEEPAPAEKAYPYAPATPEVAPSRPGYPGLGPSAPEPSMPIAAGPPTSHEMLNKDIEIISSKLDALKAGLESINQRLANLERYARHDYEKRW